ncbi:MAG TPA: AlwI family type II restriction endonuclease [Candidatus Jorgensenbacteria bacterium]|nr:AlwI family type II restriction endonuclease [Candidatus Jorgensenbacteria bacterium]
MASITDKKTIFFVTSPRSPDKLINEIRTLVENFEGEKWNEKTQKDFYLHLSKQDFFKGSTTGDLAFKARDRINRAPKALGFVDLSPVIKLTNAGKLFLTGKRSEEVFLRQLIKFQLHSPYHTDKNDAFRVKPYLELMRLVYELGGLSKHEIGLFVIGLTSYKKYDDVKSRILDFRKEKSGLRKRKVSYKQFIAEEFEKELSRLFAEKIKGGEIFIRQNKKQSLGKFIRAKKSNHLDYSDASIRYLRMTGLFSMNPRSSKVYVLEERKKDVEFILENTPRDIFKYKNEDDYKTQLFAATEPKLFVDDKERIISKILRKSNEFNTGELEIKTTEELKDIYKSILQKSLTELVENEQSKLKDYEDFDDVDEVFSSITNREAVDPSLFFEWNVWRAFSMLDDGDIQGNFKVDDDGVPLYTAPANTPDIVCKYKDFDTIVEVTLSSGQKQYEMEGEPVARHYGNYRKETQKDVVFGIFIAPKLNDAAVAHYYALYRINIEHYGGKAKIIPLSLDDLKTLLKNAYQSKKRPKAADIKTLFVHLSDLALSTSSEKEWRQKISETVQGAFIQ